VFVINITTHKYSNQEFLKLLFVANVFAYVFQLLKTTYVFQN